MWKYVGNFEAEASVCISYLLMALICLYKFGHVSSVKNALVGGKNDAHEKVNTEP